MLVCVLTFVNAVRFASSDLTPQRAQTCIARKRATLRIKHNYLDYMIAESDSLSVPISKTQRR